jgi:ATP-dependent DNA helicase RecQ
VSRPTLTADLAAGLSRYLHVPVVGRWAVVDPDVLPGQGSANSAQRVAAVGRRAALQLDEPVDGRQVLLVDDLVVTGWTLTLAARALRDAGAAQVHPLALATTT